MKHALYTFALIPALLASTAAQAQDTSYLSLSGGVYDVLDNDEAFDLRAEYRDADPVFWDVKPWMGVEATSEGTLWGGGGLLLDLNLSDDVYLAPSVGVGLYGQGSSDKDLGSAIEFRSQIEGGYQFDNGQRVGAAFSHMSNWGLDDKNPGTEILGIYYHIPVGSL